MKEFPQYLHRPYRLLWFEMDEILVMIFGYMLSMMFTIKLLLLVPFMVYLFRVEKRKRPRGFFRHIWYRVGIMEFKGYPSYFQRNFQE